MCLKVGRVIQRTSKNETKTTVRVTVGEVFKERCQVLVTSNTVALLVSSESLMSWTLALWRLAHSWTRHSRLSAFVFACAALHPYFISFALMRLHCLGHHCRVVVVGLVGTVAQRQQRDQHPVRFHRLFRDAPRTRGVIGASRTRGCGRNRFWLVSIIHFPKSPSLDGGKEELSDEQSRVIGTFQK